MYGGYSGAFVCLHVHVCMFRLKVKFQLEPLILIQLPVGAYKIAQGKYLHYGMPIALLMAGAEFSTVAR